MIEERQRLFAEYERAAKAKPTDLRKMAEIWDKAAADPILSRWLQKLDDDLGEEFDKIRTWARQKYSALGALAGGDGPAPDLVGRWDRIATYGRKAQQILGEDGQAIDVVHDLSERTFREWVDNFARLYKGRRIPYDYEHKVLAGSANAEPVEALAFANGLCAVKGGQVFAFFSQDPNVTAPDPVELLEQLRQKYPGDPDADGCWAYRCAVTRLGAETLPNCEQLSPLFKDNDADESGQPIGSRLLNISVVGVSHQDRTVLNLPVGLSKRVGLSKGAKIMEMDDKEFLGKLGLAEGASKEQMATAFAAYQDETQDPKETRAAMRAKFGKLSLGDLEIVHTDEDEPRKDASVMAMAALSKRVKQAEDTASQAQQKLASIEEARGLEGFADWAINQEMRWDPADRQGAIALGKKLGVEEAKAFVQQHFPRRPAALGQRFSGGNPIGTGAPQGGSAWGLAGSTAVRGAALSKLAGEIATKDKIDYGAALLRAKAQNPHLY